ncbi:MAG TPA: hypothetical protein VM243_07665 [Phycisphaerae bacterium]|nr:hypothetical protein [Phycisphaerae bacterium]
MVGRYTGACLGLLAFAITIVAGLSVNNPPMLVLSRAVWALAAFCAIGLLLGAVAQAVLNEHHHRREQAVLGAAGADATAEEGGDDTPDAAENDQTEPTDA